MAGDVRLLEIDGLTNDHIGFVMSATRPTWPDGDMITVDVEISSDGGNTWIGWLSGTFHGGGQDDASIQASWPGVADGQGGRLELKQTNVRAKVTALQGVETALTLSAR